MTKDKREVWTVRVVGLTLDEICNLIDGKKFGDSELVRAAHVGDMFEEYEELEAQLRAAREEYTLR